MMTQKLFAFGVFVLLNVLLGTVFCQGAIISGEVYDMKLNRLDNVIVFVDSEPVQRFIVMNHTYYFELPPGTYTLTARTFEDGTEILGADEIVTVKKEGRFVFDLILLPVEPGDTTIQSRPDNNGMNLRSVLEFTDTFAILLILSFIVFYFAKKYLKKTETKNDDLNDSVAKQVFEIIKKEKRITQKEIRKKLPDSEAKVSLVITELQTKGYIKKIKKGRGNIIIFNKKTNSD